MFIFKQTPIYCLQNFDKYMAIDLIGKPLLYQVCKQLLSRYQHYIIKKEEDFNFLFCLIFSAVLLLGTFVVSYCLAYASICTFFHATCATPKHSAIFDVFEYRQYLT